MTDEILGNNPLDERDSIWKVPEPKNSPKSEEAKDPADDLDFPDPLEGVEESESVIPSVNESDSAEDAYSEESSDYFEIPDIDSEALSDEEQDALHEDYSEEGELNEEFIKAVDSGEEEISEPEISEPEIEDVVSEESAILATISVQELDTICSEGADTATLGFEADFANILTDQIKETLPRDAESTALYAKFEGSAPAAVPTAMPDEEPEQTLPVLAEEDDAAPASAIDEKVVTENLANMMTIEDLIINGGQDNSQPQDSSQGTMPITVDDLSGSAPQGIGSMDINSYIISNDLPAMVEPSELPVTRDDANEFAQSTFRRNEEDKPDDAENIFTSMIQLVGFKLDAECYGIDIMQIQEIIRLQDVTPVPRSANFILGVLNLRGKVIPIIDLRRRFSLSKAKATSQTRIVIVNIDVGVIGFVVDEVSEVIRIPKTSIETAPATSTNINAEYIKGVGHLGDLGEELLIILDLNKVLTKDRKEVLEELIQV